MNNYAPPKYECPLCPRLVDFRLSNRETYPEFYNGPVPSFGQLDAKLLIIGLAPGLKGANQTGRPFTGDYAGLVLYSALKKNRFAEGEYDPSCFEGRGAGSDNFKLINCRVTNAVRCVPPANKPEPFEIRQCNKFLLAEIRAMQELKVIVTLGQIAHKAVIQALGFRQAEYTFGHAEKHRLQLTARELYLINSYHSSRYNINTGVLTQTMFDDVIAAAKKILT